MSLAISLNGPVLGLQGLFRPYGTSWNETTDSYTSKLSPSPVHNAMRIVLLTPGSESTGGVVLNQYDYTKDSSGNTVALDGSQGQVMLRIPKFYYKYTYTGSSHNWLVSNTLAAGFSVHPWFIKDAVEVPYRYLGVYPATATNVSGVYTDGDGTNSWFNTSTSKLGSIAGKKAVSNKTRAVFRAAAARIGSGWSLMDFYGYAAIKLLYITKYGNLNSQSVLGAGNSQFASFTFSTCISATGKVTSMSAPGQSTAGGNSGDYSNLFGLEDMWGGLWQQVDGWNINSGANYVCSNPSQFADDTATNYALFGSTNVQTSGWQSTLQQNIGFLPASVGASSTTKITDYYYYSGGWVAPFVSGDVTGSANAGLFDLRATSGSSLAGGNITSRVCF